MLNTRHHIDTTEKTQSPVSLVQLLFVALIALLIMVFGSQAISLFFMSAGIWGPGLVIYWLIQTATHKSEY